jgi:hypothetical protein
MSDFQLLLPAVVVVETPLAITLKSELAWWSMTIHYNPYICNF